MKPILSAGFMLVLCLLSPAGADELDGWCAQVHKASSIIICSDGELRAETLTRQKLFDVLKERLTPEQHKALLAEQSNWVKTYTARCGVSIDAPPPSVPVNRSVVECYLRESRSRTAELTRRYAWAIPQELLAGGKPAPPLATISPPVASPTPRPTTSATTDVVLEAWYTCLYDAADTLSEQPEPASVVVEAAFGACTKYKIAYRESVPSLTWDQTETIIKSAISPKVLARVMTVRAARAKLREQKERTQPPTDYSKM
jgi:uncharacterized protein YecT (DUF1311 family)